MSEGNRVLIELSKLSIMIVIILLAINSSVLYNNEVDNIKYSRSASGIDTISINRATYYNPAKSQCDDTPYYTANMSYIDSNKLKAGKIRWVALSWDLVNDAFRRKVAYRDWAWNGPLKFNSTIKVISKSHPYLNGDWIVKDVMNPRYRNTMDFLFSEDNSPNLGVAKDIKIIYNSSL